jgi:hypothetical protein
MPVPGIDVYPVPPPRGPLVVRGQVEIRSGENVATVVGLTVASLAPDAVNALRGPAGADGQDGAPGLDAPPGPTGATGPVGPPGAQGAAGPAGLDGQDGQQGDAGAQGATGPAGPPGATGPTGSAGADGLDGRDGTDGLDGQKGDTGPAGATGATGPQGIQGLAGTAGLDGQDGRDGIDGAKGDTGAAGAPGATGSPGPAGADGMPGLDGAPGADGLDGVPGAAGPAGTPGSAGVDGLDGFPGMDGRDGEDQLFGNIPLYPWWQTLQLNPRSGPYSPLIEVGQFINFGVDGPTSGNPHLRSGDTVFRMRATNALSLGGGTSATLFTTTGSLVLAADAGNVVFQTTLTNRFVISGSGEWLLPSSAGSSGQVITSQGPGTAPVWATPSGGGAGAIMQVATVDFGNDPTTSGFFDITGLSSLTLNTNFDVSIAVDPTDPSEAEETCLISGIAISTTVIRCYWHALTVMQGTRKVQFYVPTSVTGTTSATSGNAITVTSTVDLTGSTSTINTTPFAGAQGVVDISTLKCGGVYTVQNVTADAVVDGFTAKNDGFFFWFNVRDATTAFVVRFTENIGNTTTSLRCPDIRDLLAFKNDTVLWYYSNNRWRSTATIPKTWLLGVADVTWAVDQSPFIRTSDGQNRIRVTLTGPQRLEGLAPAVNTQNGEVVIVDNVDGTENLTIGHEDTSVTAASRIVCPSGLDLDLPPRSSVVLAYDDTSQRWRVIAHSAPDSVPKGPGNIMWEDETFQWGITGLSLASTTQIPCPNGNLYWQALGNISAGSVSGTDVIGHSGIISLNSGASTGNIAALFRTLSPTAGLNDNSLCLDARSISLIEFWVNPQQNTSVNMYIGVATAALSTEFGANSAFFSYDSAVSASWQSTTRASSVSTANTVGVTMVTGSWVKLKIEFRGWTGSAFSQVGFYINDVQVSRHNGNILGAVNVSPAVRIQTTTTAIRSIQVDRCRIHTREDFLWT